MNNIKALIIIIMSLISISCSENNVSSKKMNITAKEILGNNNYPAISYGGYRKSSRDFQPSVEEIKEDLKILSAIGYRILRTYNVHFAHASNLLKAINELKIEDKNFEMYVMLGIWIDCKDAWTSNPDHGQEDIQKNTLEVNEAVRLANKYPEIVKILAVGNEAMVHWASSYFVEPKIILKWVKFLQELKSENKLNKDIWITSSDNFASWGGGDKSYHKKELNELINVVDYISVHTYPFHDTYYNPSFWTGVMVNEKTSNDNRIKNAMLRSSNYAIKQFESVKNYIKSIGITKPVHIGETGWASISSDYYGQNGTRAADEYKQYLYFNNMMEYGKKNNISIFYFSAFDEPWKDYNNPNGSENHFGLFTVEGKAKYVMWENVDNGLLKGIGRNNNEVLKTYSGERKNMMIDVLTPNKSNK
ncbi:MAG: glycosyl hydrolase family 17 [Flavobacteriaceae bacterium]